MILEGRKVLVVGLGKTGEALCPFLLNQGARVKVSEKMNSEEMGQAVSFWRQKGVPVETGKHELESFLESDLIVPSPGVPMIPELEASRKKGIKIISEIELAYSFLKGKIVGITGSNGKSTTATLIHKILKEGGFEAFLAGNIGMPLISFVENSKDEHIYVTEISSFQLEYAEAFRVAVSIFLNISPDHLDWHTSFNDYFEAKKKLLTSQRENDIAILNRDDPQVWSLHSEGPDQVYAFSRKSKVSLGSHIEGDWVMLHDKDKKEERLMKSTEIPLIGIHNQENILASSIVGHIYGLPLSRIKDSIKSFKGLEHRLEKVLTIKGVDFYNDSKATNIDATLKSIQSFEKKIILILGGRDKGGDFHKLKKAIREKVKKIILIGEAKERIEKALNNASPLASVASLKEAVRVGYSEARPGEIILLAPACTSFDMFLNFEERGRVFKQEVFALERSLEEETR
ncbi:MAG: UDP-N-acetylmuramoyl-L-alanine--D-glutamate ligase [Candidatus Aminicenantes bacterium]|nr:MAG: UDP-N-acetylmuramoyl-L-alanine--D-glutamate ligase [Candidatus Aminicenantes bacterium]